MPVPPPTPHLRIPPEETVRRRRAQAVLVTLLVAALGIPLGRGWHRALSARGPPPASQPGDLRLTVDLARDPAWRLALLPGVGPRRAQAIVRARERSGPARTLEALRRVPNLGARTAAGLRDVRSLRVLLAGQPVGCRDEPRSAPPGRRPAP